MNIKLGDKTFAVSKIKSRMVRKAIELTEKINFNNMKASDLDSLIDYMVELYEKQFNIDDVYDGLEANQLIPTLMDCINSVVGTMGAKLEKFPNA